MSKTIQLRSWATLSEPGETPTNENNSEPEDNRKLLLTVYDNLNKLYEKLNRLNYVIEKRKLENYLYLKGIKEEE
jgi:hypothetical protein